MQESDFSHKIEDIKHHLYDPDNKATQRRREGILHTVKYKVADDWEKPLEEQKIMKKKSKFFKKLFVIAIIFFVCALGFAGYKYFSGGSLVSSDNIQISLLGNSFTQGGEELSLQIEIINKNNAKLELANLIIEYPKGASDATDEMVRLPRESLGTINAGGRVERNIKVKLFGDQGAVRNIKVRLEYHPEGSNAIFVKDKLYIVSINSTPINLTLEGPQSVSPNQDIGIGSNLMPQVVQPYYKPALFFGIKLLGRIRPVVPIDGADIALNADCLRGFFQPVFIMCRISR